MSDFDFHHSPVLSQSSSINLTCTFIIITFHVENVAARLQIVLVSEKKKRILPSNKI